VSPSPLDLVDEGHRQLVRAACLDGPEAAAAWRAWRTLVDFDDMDEPSGRLLPAVARRTDVLTDDDDVVRGRIRGLYRRAWVANHLLWQETAPVLVALGAGAIPVMLLKGAALRRFYDGDIGARPMYDIDILVRPEHARRALGILDGLGWEPEFVQSSAGIGARLAFRRHSTGFVRGENGRLDLHWHALATSIGARADDAFWRAARPAADGGPELVMHPADLLLHVLVHGTTGNNAPPLQWIVDAFRIVGGSEEPLGGRLAMQARAHGVVRKVTTGLRVVETVTGSTIGGPLFEALGDERPGGLERVRHGWAGRGRADRVLDGLAKHAAGETGLLHGAADFVSSRLDLPLTRRPVVTIAHAALGRPPGVARVARRFGPLSRILGTSPPPVGVGTVLDFTDPDTLDSYGGPGWQSTTELGAEARGDEVRLVLPVKPGAGPSLWAVLSFTTLQTAPVLVAVDERPCATTRGGVGPVEVAVPLGPGVDGQPVEISLRSIRRGAWPGRVGLRLQSVRVTTSSEAT
jgi:hypothetical protein